MIKLRPLVHRRIVHVYTPLYRHYKAYNRMLSVPVTYVVTYVDMLILYYGIIICIHNKFQK